MIRRTLMLPLLLLAAPLTAQRAPRSVPRPASDTGAVATFVGVVLDRTAWSGANTLVTGRITPWEITTPDSGALWSGVRERLYAALGGRPKVPADSVYQGLHLERLAIRGDSLSGLFFVTRVEYCRADTTAHWSLANPGWSEDVLEHGVTAVRTDGRWGRGVEQGGSHALAGCLRVWRGPDSLLRRPEIRPSRETLDSAAMTLSLARVLGKLSRDRAAVLLSRRSDQAWEIETAGSGPLRDTIRARLPGFLGGRPRRTTDSVYRLIRFDPITIRGDSLFTSFTLGRAGFCRRSAGPIDPRHGDWAIGRESWEIRAERYQRFWVPLPHDGGVIADAWCLELPGEPRSRSTRGPD